MCSHNYCLLSGWVRVRGIVASRGTQFPLQDTLKYNSLTAGQPLCEGAVEAPATHKPLNADHSGWFPDDHLGVTGASLFFLLRVISSPLWAAHNGLKRRLRAGAVYVEMWSVGWMIVLFLIPPAIVSPNTSSFVRVVLVLLPILRYADILHTFMDVSLIQRHPPTKSPARALILLFIHYIEIVLIFAALYLFFQVVSHQHLFVIGPDKVDLTAGQAIYFSVITAATIGFGDITPLSAVTRFPSTVRALISVEALTILMITLIDIPRQITYLPKQQPQQRDISKS